MTWRLLALPPLSAELLESLFGDPRIELITPPARTQQAVDALLPTVDLVLGDWTPQLRINDPGERVSFVQQPSAGVDGIDLAACAARGVAVANCAGANATSVAEWCLSATFALLRKTVQADAAVRLGDWPQTTLGGRELAGQRVGVIGMGAVGSETARLFAALGCQVTYWSRTQHPTAPVPYADLDELLRSSDIVVLVIALGAQTKGLLDVARLAKMKRGALLINGARGEVVVEAALLAALTDGTLAAAALDVFSQEPLPADSPLRQATNLLLSPHVAGSTVEASMRIVGQARANLLRVLDGEPVRDVVNEVPSIITRRSSHVLP